MSKTLKSLLSVLALAAVLGGGYYFLVIIPAGEVVNTATSSVDVTAKTQSIITNISRIKKYKMDDEILTDKRFTSLKNVRSELPSVDTGRTDPFAPTP